MSLLIIQLSDLHASSGSNPVEARIEHLCRAAASEVTSAVSAIAVVFSGDAAYGGKPEEFASAKLLLDRVVGSLRLLDRPVVLLCVPGNHDCDVTAEDESAREALRAAVKGAERPPDSILRQLLTAQKAYFDFATSLPAPAVSVMEATPFYVWHDIQVDGRRLRFHLLNSSWTSMKKERDDLLFPLGEFLWPSEPEADYAVTVLHHPVHWFSLLDVRSGLRSRIEEVSDLVLTGHEHQNERSRRSLLGGPEIDYQAGGVLQEHGDPSRCSFTTFEVDVVACSCSIRRYQWSQDHFALLDPTSVNVPLLANPVRRDRRYRWKPTFEASLDELQDPLTHPRVRDLKVSHLFVFPDLRRVSDFGSGDEANGDSTVVDRVKGDDVRDELMAQQRVLVTGGEKFGKTSLARQMIVHLRRDGRVPLLLDGAKLGKCTTDERLRTHIDKALRYQYTELSLAAFEQLNAELRVVVVDDFDEGPIEPAARAALVEALGRRFGSVQLFAGDEILVELLGQRGSDAAALFSYQRYEICEFLHLRLEELAVRWVLLGLHDPDEHDVRAKVTELCAGVESLLAVAGMPHTPYLLTAIMSELDEMGVDSPDIALKNGNYGPIYEATITRALTLSDWPTFDLTGKKTYLSELAYEIYRRDAPTLSEGAAREFHAGYCERYTNLDFDRVIRDLVNCRMLRQDGSQIAFRHKYTFCYFVARWLSRNLRKPDRADAVRETVVELGDSLHHDTSANILVFLAHDSEDPEILGAIRDAAASQYPRAPLASLEEDIDKLNALPIAKSLFVLPSSPPEINRKLIQDAEDERKAIARQAVHDGREMQLRPPRKSDGNLDETVGAQREQLRKLRAALRTIRILGQVARNGASSMERRDLLAMVQSVVNLGRRVLGEVFRDLESLDDAVRFVKRRCFAYMVKAKRSELEDEQISLSDLKPIAKEADFVAKHYVFGLYWIATLGVIKRLAHAVGLQTLDPVIADLRASEDNVVHNLLHLQIQFGRRSRQIPVEEISKLHRQVQGDGNRLVQIVIEAMTYERLLVQRTEYRQKQRICSQLSIKVPRESLDQTRHKFTS